LRIGRQLFKIRTLPMPQRTGRYRLLLLAVTIWLALIFLAPLARAGHSATWPFIYGFFRPVCHQQVDRSFSAYGHPLAVCHRCLGLYTGFWLGLLLLPRVRRPCGQLLARPRLLLVTLAPLAIDLAIGNTPASRFLTGAIAAAPTALFVWIAAEEFRRPRLLRRCPVSASGSSNSTVTKPQTDC
jgi:uncharacterized membrane protein